MTQTQQQFIQFSSSQFTQKSEGKKLVDRSKPINYKTYFNLNNYDVMIVSWILFNDCC